MPTLADIVRRHGPEYLRQFGARMPAEQRRALRDIARCRTPALGGQRWQCPRCGEERFSFHSCGNRHCPACGADDARQWLDRQQALLLPVEYHLATFTVPEALRRPLRSHPRELLALLFQTAASTLLDLCASPRWFGATPGVTAVLHTWTRQLEYHPHVHFLVTGGGLDRRGVWHQPGKGFLVPVHALSRVFRARFRDALQERHPGIFAAIPSRVWSQPWVVHSQSVGSGEHALHYLARYLYRVALANRAILSADDHAVRFRFRRSEDGKQRACALAPAEFLRRFLQHVLPRGFVKVRSYGLHHSSRKAVLPLLRAALCLRAGRPVPAMPAPTPPPPCRCPRCQTIMFPVEQLRPVRSVPTLFRFDPPARGPPP